MNQPDAIDEPTTCESRGRGTRSPPSVWRHRADPAGPASTPNTRAEASQRQMFRAHAVSHPFWITTRFAGSRGSPRFSPTAAEESASLHPHCKLLRGARDTGQVLGATCGPGQVSAGACPWEAVKSRSKSGRCS